MDIFEVFNRTNWRLLAEQKETLFRLTMEHDLPDALDGLVNWLDAVQDAAEIHGYPVVFLTEDDESPAKE